MSDKKNEAPKQDEVITVAAATLTGDIRDFLLDRVKNLGKPWPAMSEQEQRDQITSAKDAAERLVRKVCEIVAADGKKALKGKLIKVQIKDKIQCQVDFNKEDEQRHELFDSQGLTVMLVVADAEKFTGETGPAEPEPDQGDLIGNAEKLKKNDGKVTPLR